MMFDDALEQMFALVSSGQMDCLQGTHRQFQKKPCAIRRWKQGLISRERDDFVEIVTTLRLRE
jgi:hypothetical protein